MSHIIIGTAGHVDHGKTMLIKALTGMDTDRLQEEKERGISIDLGFAPFDLPGGRRAGVVDVPGHERFINNMLAGIGGIDLVLLVVDVTEGVMPQTKEHLAILNLLKIKKGIVVLTKIDLAEEEWIDLVEEEVSEELENTFLEGAPLARVSVVSEKGIDELKSLIDEMTAAISPRDENPPLRMPVDRVFSIAGFGTVLTGTLLTGAVLEGEEVEVLPAGIKARVRQVQVHGDKVERAHAGQRVALNLAHLERADINRGSVVATPGYFQATSLLDARLYLLDTAPRPIKNLTPLHLYLGTGRVVARVVLLDTRELKPGETALVQFRLEKPLVAHRQDRFIVRSYSPVTTVGGGLVIDHLPERHKRFKEDIIKDLRYLEKGDPTDYVRQQLRKKSPQALKELSPLVRLSPEQLTALLAGMEKRQEVLDLGGFFALREIAVTWMNKIQEELASYHKKNNLSPGMSRASLKGTLGRDFPPRAYDGLLTLLVSQGRILIKGDTVALSEFEPNPSKQQMNYLTELEGIYSSGGFSPPSFRDAAVKAGVGDAEMESLVGYLVKTGVLVKVSEGLAFHRESFERAMKVLEGIFQSQGRASLADVRDALGTSRKYAQAFLEYLDQQKITLREGDYRLPWKR